MDSVTTREVATIAVEAEEYMSEFVAAMDIERVPTALLAVVELRKRLQRLETAMEDRWKGDGEGKSWRAEDGTLYAFQGAPGWEELGNPDALMNELFKVVPVHLQHLVNRSVKTKKVYDHTMLNQLATGDERCAEVIAKYRVRKYGPPHLKAVEGER